MDLVYGLIAIGAGLAVTIAAAGSGIGQGIAASAAIGATTEKDEMFAKGLILAAITETQAIYGFVIAALLIFVFAAT